MKETITPFGAAIRRARLKRNLSMMDVAKATRISAPYVFQLETSRFKPHPSFVTRIARFFDVDPLRWLKLALPDEFKIWAAAFDHDCAQRQSDAGSLPASEEPPAVGGFAG